MAKRKRLTPPQAGYLDGAGSAPAPAMRALKKSILMPCFAKTFCCTGYSPLAAALRLHN